MPVEQGLPSHPVATGLAGQAIPFIVAASHAHAPPSAPFWFPVPAVLVASPALLCPSSLSAVPALVPPGVAPAFCVSVLLPPPVWWRSWVPLSRTPSCPTRLPPPPPVPNPPFTRSPPCGCLGQWRPTVQPGRAGSTSAHPPPPLPQMPVSQMKNWGPWKPTELVRRGRGGGGDLGGRGGPLGLHHAAVIWSQLRRGTPCAPSPGIEPGVSAHTADPLTAAPLEVADDAGDGDGHTEVMSHREAALDGAPYQSHATGRRAGACPRAGMTHRARMLLDSSNKKLTTMFFRYISCASRRSSTRF